MFAAWPQLRNANFIYLRRPGHRDRHTPTEAAQSAAATATTPTATAVTEADATRSGKSARWGVSGGRGGGEERGGGDRSPWALAGTTCVLAGSARKERITATTDYTASEIRQGRPRGGAEASKI